MKRISLACAVLDFVGRMHDWSDANIAQFCRKLYYRRVKYLRIFLFNVWGPQDPSSQPYEKDENGVFDLRQFNERFFIQLARLNRICNDFRIALYVDLFDHCGTKKAEHRAIHPWYNNCNGIKGIYDPSILAQYFRNKLAEKIIEIIGIRNTYPAWFGTIEKKLHPNWLGLWNEATVAHADRHEFGRCVAYPLAAELRRLGYRQKILYSADDIAGHAIAAYVSSEEGWQTEFKKGDTVRQFHGAVSTAWMTERARKVVHGRWFAISTDGTFGKCPSIGMVKAIIRKAKELCRDGQRHLHHYEDLPLSIANVGTLPWEIDIKRDLEVFSMINRVFNKQKNRRLPKWLLRMYGN